MFACPGLYVYRPIKAHASDEVILTLECSNVEIEQSRQESSCRVMIISRISKTWGSLRRILSRQEFAARPVTKLAHRKIAQIRWIPVFSLSQGSQNRSRVLRQTLIRQRTTRIAVGWPQRPAKFSSRKVALRVHRDRLLPCTLDVVSAESDVF